MVTHSDEEVEEQLASLLHLLRHCAAPLKGVAATDDQSKEVSPKLRVAIRSVGVCPAGRSQDSRDCNIRLQTLLPEGEALEVIKTIAFCRTANEC